MFYFVPCEFIWLRLVGNWFSNNGQQSQVDYFISHWWGTPFVNFCESVKRHAIHMSHWDWKMRLNQKVVSKDKYLEIYLMQLLDIAGN